MENGASETSSEPGKVWEVLFPGCWHSLSLTAEEGFAQD